jgi:hypothetical protein
VTEADLAPLPAAVSKYLHAGRPRPAAQLVIARALRREIPPRTRPILDALGRVAVQLGYRGSRLFRMHRLLARVVPMWGWDTHRVGRGRLHVKLLNLITVADGAGPEFDTGELVTRLTDAVLMAPSLLLGTATTWQDTVDHSFGVSICDAGRR